MAASQGKAKKEGLLERLASGRPIVGDGSFVFTLEKRGYVRAGPWTSEAAVQHPDAVRQLSREFLRAGADVIQAYTFFSTDDRLKLYKATECEQNTDTTPITTVQLNSAACDIAREVANEGNALVNGPISPTTSFVEGKGKEAVQEEFKKQCSVYMEKDVDYLLAEFFVDIRELEWGIEVLKKTGKPVASTMRICTLGDANGVSPGECAVRMAKAGADVIGLNCLFDPTSCIATMRMMKEALDEAGLKPYLMAQPAGFHSQEVNDKDKMGYFAFPEWPLAMESRLISRIDAHKFAREAYDLGVRYIGGCCGFEPYHIRAIAEELAEERGVRPPGYKKDCLWGDALAESTEPSEVWKANKEYWTKLVCASGRADATPLAEIPDMQF